MNSTKVKKILELQSKILAREAKMLEEAANEIDVQRGVFLVRGTHGYDVELDGVSFGMDLAYGQALKIRDLVEEGRIKNGWAPSGPGPAKKLDEP